MERRSVLELGRSGNILWKEQSECEKGNRLFIFIFFFLKLSLSEGKITHTMLLILCLYFKIFKYFSAWFFMQESAPVHIRKGLPCEGESFPSLKWKVIVFSTWHFLIHLDHLKVCFCTFLL